MLDKKTTAALKKIGFVFETYCISFPISAKTSSHVYENVWVSVKRIPPGVNSVPSFLKFFITESFMKGTMAGERDVGNKLRGIAITLGLV
jgi:hypothetical protein